MYHLPHQDQRGDHYVRATEGQWAEGLLVTSLIVVHARDDWHNRSAGLQQRHELRFARRAAAALEGSADEATCHLDNVLHRLAVAATPDLAVGAAVHLVIKAHDGTLDSGAIAGAASRHVVVEAELCQARGPAPVRSLLLARGHCAPEIGCARRHWVCVVLLHRCSVRNCGSVELVSWDAHAERGSAYRAGNAQSSEH